MVARHLAVSIHAPTKGATCTSRTIPSHQSVSIHAPTKGATGSIPDGSAGHIRFNPRSHEGSDPLPDALSQLLSLFQSTLPRRERQETVRAIEPVDIVSIHAPTKGATLYRWRTVLYKIVSIHAPTKGATEEI